MNVRNDMTGVLNEHMRVPTSFRWLVRLLLWWSGMRVDRFSLTTSVRSRGRSIDISFVTRDAL